MKIAIHQPRISYYYGGGERVPLEQAHHFSERDHDVTIITVRSPVESALFRAFRKDNPRVRIVCFEPSLKLAGILRRELGHSRRRIDQESIEFGKMTMNFYKENQFDIVATHYTVDSLFIPRNQNVILELHGCSVQRRMLDKRSIDRANTLTSVARSVSDHWRSMYKLKRPIYLTYNGVDSLRFKPERCPKRYDLLYVGRLIKVKGVDDLIYSLSTVTKNFPNITVMIVGKGPDEKRLRYIARKQRMIGHITWRKSISDEELLQLYNMSRMCVFPSVAKEGVLTTMLEAASCGAAIITTKCCGMPEFIRHNINGVLVSEHDSRALAEATIRLLEEPRIRKDLGKQARHDIQNSWTWQKRVDVLLKVYKKSAVDKHVMTPI